MKHVAMSAGLTSNWIGDSGATCHMGNDRSMFVEYQNFKRPEKIMVTV